MNLIQIVGLVMLSMGAGGWFENERMTNQQVHKEEEEIECD
jgi:hypothetical protein